MKTTYIMEMDDQGRITAMKELDHSGYQKGLEDAWNAARKICRNPADSEFSCKDLENTFGYAFACEVFEKFSAAEAINKLIEYDERNLRVGDIVAGVTHHRGVVVKVNEFGCNVLWENGDTGFHSHRDLDKVNGCTLGIDLILKEIKNMKGVKS